MKVNLASTVEAQSFEEKMAASGHYAKNAITMANGGIYLGDGRDGLFKENKLVDLASAINANKLLEKGEVDAADRIKSFSDKYFDLKNIIAGAAGPESVSAHEAIRKTAELLAGVIGQDRTLEDLTAINAVTVDQVDSLRAEYIRKTSSVITVGTKLGDKQRPPNARQAFAVGEKEIYADGIMYEELLRDKNHKVNLKQAFLDEMPGAFFQAKEDKIVTLLEAVSGNNQGNWAAFTAGLPDVDAAAQVDTAVNAIKGFKKPIITMMNSDTWRLYMRNMQGGFFNGVDANRAGVTTALPTEKSGTLPGNKIPYFINDSITSQAYVAVAVGAWAKLLQGMVINTSFQDKTVSGQPTWSFYWDFNDVEETEPSAAYRGETVGA